MSMPTLRVWVKKSVTGPNGTIEIGLGGTHEVTCEPHQVARERLALYQNYKDEVDRLIGCELTGEPVARPAAEPPRHLEPAEEESSPLTRERSRQMLAELQERLAQRGRARDLLAGLSGDPRSGSEATSRETSTAPGPVDDRGELAGSMSAPPGPVGDRGELAGSMSTPSGSADDPGGLAGSMSAPPGPVGDRGGIAGSMPAPLPVEVEEDPP
jgi:hypothetical protein